MTIAAGFTLDDTASRGQSVVPAGRSPRMIGNFCVAFDMNQRSVGTEGVGVALEVNPMQLRNSVRGYGAVSLSLHWLTAGFIVLAWLLGTFGDDLPRGAARSTGLFIHIWAGLAIIVLVALRIAWRLFDPPLPPSRRGSAIGRRSPPDSRILPSMAC
jgi:Prokaryotic cytochrome b561